MTPSLDWERKLKAAHNNLDKAAGGQVSERTKGSFFMKGEFLRLEKQQRMPTFNRGPSLSGFQEKPWREERGGKGD